MTLKGSILDTGQFESDTLFLLHYLVLPYFHSCGMFIHHEVKGSEWPSEMLLFH